MAHCVFMHRSDSIYDDSPAVQYQFPKQYLGRAEPSIGDWIIYLETTKVRETRGYFAVAQVQQIIPDPKTPDMFLALIEPNSYLEFANEVPFNNVDGPIERGLLNDEGKLSGRAQSAVRPISDIDFNRIVDCESALEFDPFRRPTMTPVFPQFIAFYQLLTGIREGSPFRADRGSNRMPIHSRYLVHRK